MPYGRSPMIPLYLLAAMLALATVAPARAAEPVRVPAQVETGLALGAVDRAAAATWEGALFAGTENLFVNVTIPVVFTADGVLPRTWDDARDFAHALRVLSYRGESDDLKVSLFLGEETRLGDDGVARNLLPQLLLEHPVTLASLQLWRSPVNLRLRLFDVTEPRLGNVSATVDWPRGWRWGGAWWGVRRLPVELSDGLGDVRVDAARGVVEPARTRWFSAQQLGVEHERGGFAAGLRLVNLEPTDPAATGALLSFGTARPWRGLTFRVEGGAGGKAWTPWPLGPFFLVRELAADLGTLQGGQTLAQRLDARTGPGWGALAQAGWESDKLAVRMGAFATPLERTVDAAADAFLGRRFILAAHGAWDQQGRAWTLSLEARLAFGRHWYAWSRAQSLYVLDVESPRFARVDLLMLGVGIRTRLE
jgi:hypothetical protein